MEECFSDADAYNITSAGIAKHLKGDRMYPEDLFDAGSYIDTATGDIWEKKSDGKWTVNGMPHKPFPHSLVPEQDTIAESHSEFRANPANRELRDKDGYCE